MRPSSLLILAFLLYSCSPQDRLCFDHDQHDRRAVAVRFDWSSHPEATPATMSLYLYPHSGAHFTRHEFIGRDGGPILVSPGHYTAIAINSDNSAVRLVNADDPRLVSIALRDVFETQGQSSVRDGEAVCLAPDSLWTAYIDDVFIADSSLVIPMNEAVCHTTLEIRHLRDSHLVSSIDATLSGMHRSLQINPLTVTADRSRLLFSVAKLNGDSCKAHFFTLGHCGRVRQRSDSDTDHFVTLAFRLGDGSTRYHSECVTDQLHSQPPDPCHIVIDTLELPPKTGSGGVDLSIDDWHTIDINITPNNP